MRGGRWVSEKRVQLPDHEDTADDGRAEQPTGRLTARDLTGVSAKRQAPSEVLPLLRYPPHENLVSLADYLGFAKIPILPFE